MILMDKVTEFRRVAGDCGIGRRVGIVGDKMGKEGNIRD